jgi:hypothetical protein
VVSTLDFFDSAAAICVVVLFAKFVTHRHRRRGSAGWGVIALHVLCVALAAFGLVAALVGTESESDWARLHGFVWFGTLGSLALLLGDALLVDVAERRRGGRRQKVVKEST